jgi:hypothetical protein
MGACGLSFEYTRCGGLYANPVIPTDCPDPGVLRTSDGYVLSCTSGDDGDAFPIYTSPDLVAWTPVGHIFPSGHWPSWAASDFWAPEIHLVGSHFVAYFAARNSAGAPKSPGRTWRSLGLASLIPRPLLPRGEKGCQRRSRRRDLSLFPSWEKGGRGVEGRAKVGAIISTGRLSVGAASSMNATGPFTDTGQPLVQDASMGLIDPSEITAADGTPYVLWKEDGNAVSLPTPIQAQALSADGLSLAPGSATTLITAGALKAGELSVA